MVGPFCWLLSFLTVCRKSRIGSTNSGTFISLQSVKWRCLTIFDSSPYIWWWKIAQMSLLFIKLWVLVLNFTHFLHTKNDHKWHLPCNRTLERCYQFRLDFLYHFHVLRYESSNRWGPPIKRTGLLSLTHISLGQFLKHITNSKGKIQLCWFQISCFMIHPNVSRTNGVARVPK